MDFSSILNKIFIRIDGAEKGSPEINFYAADGSQYRMWHSQDCCESVTIEDIEGNVQNLLNSPIVMAYASSNTTDQPPPQTNPESYTWTFYRLSTVLGGVVIRWFGESNGYYSEGVDFEEVKSADRIYPKPIPKQKEDQKTLGEFDLLF